MASSSQIKIRSDSFRKSHRWEDHALTDSVRSAPCFRSHLQTGRQRELRLNLFDTDFATELAIITRGPARRAAKPSFQYYTEWIAMLPTGSTVAGRYEVRGIVDERGSYITYLVRDLKLKRDAALKTFRDAPSDAAVERFVRECDLLTFISHPAVIEVFDRGDLAGNEKELFCVFALVPGVTLDQLILAESRRLTPIRVAEIMSQACRGVQAAHNAGLAHRPIEAADVLVMKDDSVKILRFLPDTQHSPAGNVYRLGALTYEALMLRPAPEDPPARALLVSNPDVSESLADVIGRAMDNNPLKRFACAGELGEALLGAVRWNPTVSSFEAGQVRKTTEAHRPEPITGASQPPGEFTRIFSSGDLGRALESAAAPAVEALSSAKADIGTAMPEQPGEFTRMFTLGEVRPGTPEPAPTPLRPSVWKTAPSTSRPSADADNSSGLPEVKPSAQVEAEIPPPRDFTRLFSVNKTLTGEQRPGDATGLFEPPRIDSSTPELKMPEPFVPVSSGSSHQDAEPKREPTEYSKILRAPGLPISSGGERLPGGTGILSPPDATAQANSIPAAAESGFTRISNPQKTASPDAAAPVLSASPDRSRSKMTWIVIIAVVLIAAGMLILYSRS